MMRARWAAQLVLSTLVLTAGCTAEGGDTDTDEATDATAATAVTAGTDATAATDATTQPTTGGDETTAAVDVDYEMDIQPIWDLKCVAGCHTPGGIAATNGPLLGVGESYASLVDKQSPTVAMSVVTPGDPDMSYLWHKLNGTFGDVGGTGAKMPLGAGLDEPTLALIEAWIVAGAKP